MDANYEKLSALLIEYKLKKQIQPLVAFLKGGLESKQLIALEIGDALGQQYCWVLVEILNDIDPAATAAAGAAGAAAAAVSEDMATVEVVCECLMQQVTVTNVRWYLLEVCHLLFCLSRQLLACTNITMKIKIAKLLQTYLIYSSFEGKNLLAQDLVSELFKDLVNILRDNHPQEFYEVSLGLFASLCHIWSQCQEVMGVISDYQVLRKQLLRFLAADMVKRTTIVYTMTIMFHLCNSDDRLFNKRNIRQTLQVLFNIMLNGDIGWASLYATSLLTEICKSPKTCHLISEYNSLVMSLKESIYQLNTKDSITMEKYFEFILTIVKINAEFQHMIIEFLIPKTPPIPENLWSKDYDERNCHKDLLNSIILLINNSETTISVYSVKLLNIFYMNLLSSHQEVRLPKLCSLGDAVHHFFSKVTSDVVSKSNIPNKEGTGDLETASVDYLIKHRQELSELLKIKNMLELVTDLLECGDQWTSQAVSFINCIDHIIRDQLESNPLIENMSLSKNQLTNKISCLGVDVFVDLLYFYYRATEAKTSSHIFGERLKLHLEHSKTSTMLAFALSAASQNQITLQRALVLQGVCMHLQDFNVEMMGEKIFHFSSEYSSMNCRELDVDTTTKSVSACGAFVQKCRATEKSSEFNKVRYIAAESADGDNTEFHELAMSSISEVRMLQPSNIIRKPPSCQQSTEAGDIHYSRTAAHCKFTENMTYNIDSRPVDKLHLDLKVQQIVSKWMETPELPFSSAEICLIFEHRIQAMQNQEALMNEIILNKTAGLYQAETLLNQYRVNMAEAEKESKRLRSFQVEVETKIDDLNKTIASQASKIVELERRNEVLLEANELGERQKEDCLSISKKLQDKLKKIHEEKVELENSLEHFSKQLEDAYQLIALKDSQLSTYSQMSMLINKLTASKGSANAGVVHAQREDANKSLSLSNTNEFDSIQDLSAGQADHFCVNNNSATMTSPPQPPNQHAVRHTNTVSNTDFLQLYKTNSRILRSHK